MAGKSPLKSKKKRIKCNPKVEIYQAFHRNACIADVFSSTHETSLRDELDNISSRRDVSWVENI